MLFVKTTNKYRTFNSIIMENGPNFIVRLQPTIYNEFFKNDTMFCKWYSNICLKYNIKVSLNSGKILVIINNK